MTDIITVTGLVATQPRHVMTSEALPITSFRLVSTQRRFDRAASKWVDGDSNWFTVTTFRQLALNSNSSIKKGDRIVVTGRLRIRDWESGERAGTTIEIEAESLGHDLTFGTTAFARTTSSHVRPAAVDAEGAADSGDAASDPATDPASDLGSASASALALSSSAQEALAVPF